MTAELDQLTPNYLTVDAAGNVGAMFAGGVTVPATIADPPIESDAITFTRDDGSPAGRLFVKLLAGGGNALLTLEADTPAPNFASVGLRAVGAATQSVVGIDSLGNSSFLQLVSAQQLQLDHGSATATFPGASIGSNIKTVNHGLGRSPVFAIACSNGSGGGGLQVFPWFALTSSSTTQLNFRGNSGVQEPAGATAGFFWLALG